MSDSAQRSGWRLFPVAMVGGLLLVMAVNFGMVWVALRTFPGVAALDVFDHSNAYDEVLAQAAREAALGWSARADAEAAAAVLTLADHDGAALSGATVTARALRPLGPDLATGIGFAERAPGQYASLAPLPARGQWDLRVTIIRGADTLHATRRILVK